MCSKDSLNFKKDTRGETMSVYEKKSGARAKGSSKGHRLLALILSCAMALSVNAPAMTAFAVNNDSNIIVYDDEPSTSSNQKSKSSAGNTSNSNIVVYDDGEKPNTGTSTGSSSGKNTTKTTTDHQSGLVTYGDTSSSDEDLTAINSGNQTDDALDDTPTNEEFWGIDSDPADTEEPESNRAADSSGETSGQAGTDATGSSSQEAVNLADIRPEDGAIEAVPMSELTDADLTKPLTAEQVEEVVENLATTPLQTIPEAEVNSFIVTDPEGSDSTEQETQTPVESNADTSTQSEGVASIEETSAAVNTEEDTSTSASSAGDVAVSDLDAPATDPKDSSESASADGAAEGSDSGAEAEEKPGILEFVIGAVSSVMGKNALPADAANSIPDGTSNLTDIHAGTLPSRCGLGIQFKMGDWDKASFGDGFIKGANKQSWDNDDLRNGWKGTANYKLVFTNVTDAVNNKAYIDMPDAGYYYKLVNGTYQKTSLTVRMYLWTRGDYGSSAPGNCYSATPHVGWVHAPSGQKKVKSILEMHRLLCLKIKVENGSITERDSSNGLQADYRRHISMNDQISI